MKINTLPLWYTFCSPYGFERFFATFMLIKGVSHVL